MSDVESVTYAWHSAAEAVTLLEDLAATYADAYGTVLDEDSLLKARAFHGRATRALTVPTYSLVTARVDGHVVGFAFGYNLRPDTDWWRDLTPRRPTSFTAESGSRTVVLAEIEVRRAWQRQGIGRQLHDRFLGARPQERATLATGPKADAARRRYEAWGWQQIGTVPGATNDYFDVYTLYIRPLPLSV